MSATLSPRRLPDEMQRARPLPPVRSGRATVVWAIVAILICVWMWDWLPLVAFGVLWLGWRLLGNDSRSRVLALAFTYQWTQVIAGMFYYPLTGRISPEVQYLDTRPIILLDLGALVVLLLGLFAGLTWLTPRVGEYGKKLEMPFSAAQCFGAYVAVAAVHGLVITYAWRIPQLTQAILALAYLRYALVYIILSKLLVPKPRWREFFGMLSIEVVLNLTGFFADFKQPLAIAALALLQPPLTGVPGLTSAVYRRPRRTLALACVGVVTFFLTIMWTAVKTDYRAALRAGALTTRTEQLQFIARRADEWLSQGIEDWQHTTDVLVDRIWQVRFPALALTRVPDVVPHTNGALLSDALIRLVMPRLFFPNKGELINDSDKVRSFAGVYVAGRESRTSFAFGYVAEAYVDFGYRWMFFPIFGFGVFVGATFAWMFAKIRHADLAVAGVSVFAWLSVHSFEASWAYGLGQAVTLAIVLGGAVLLMDRFVLREDRAPALRPARPIGRHA